MSILTTTHLLLCGYLLGSVFERSVLMSDHVRLDVRGVFGVLSLVAGIGLVAPLVFADWRPDLWGVCMTAAVCIVQRVTAKHWKKGVPDCFYLPEFAPRRRRVDDVDVAL